MYFVTATIYNTGYALSSFFNLYLYTLYGSYVLVGAMLSYYFTISAITRFIGGYVGDVVNRKNLAVIAMLFYSIYYFILGFYTDIVVVITAMTFLASTELAKSGSSAFIMDNIPRENSGLALSIFNAAKSFGIITLVVFGITITLIEFGAAFRLFYIVIGVSLLFSTLLRALYLSGSGIQKRDPAGHVLRNFFSENMKTAKILIKTIPGITAVIILDGISDGLFRFGALIYTNVELNVEIAGINIILLATLIVQVPLLLWTGKATDTEGVYRTSLLIYGFMPVCAFLLFTAPLVTYWAPVSVINALDAYYNGLSVVVSTPFLAIVLKYVNDSMWYLLLFALIRKRMPEGDTSKFLAVLMTVMYLCTSTGPLFGGILFELLPESYLFLVVLIINSIILLVLSVSKITAERQ